MVDEIGTKLTYAQLVNILCILAVRIQRMEDVMDALDEYLKGFDATMEFQNYQILKARSEMSRYDNKTPSRRLNDLEKQFNGLIQFVNQKREKPKRKPRFD